MLLIPLVVSGKSSAGSNFCVALDLQSVILGQVTFGADMGEKVGDVTELLLSGANAASELLQRHDGPKFPRKQPVEGQCDECRDSSRSKDKTTAPTQCSGRRREDNVRASQLQSLTEGSQEGLPEDDSYHVQRVEGASVEVG